jgi:hypothetical protein
VVCMYIVVKHFNISSAPVRSRGGLNNKCYSKSCNKRYWLNLNLGLIHEWHTLANFINLYKREQGTFSDRCVGAAWTHCVSQVTSIVVLLIKSAYNLHHLESQPLRTNWSLFHCGTPTVLRIVLRRDERMNHLYLLLYRSPIGAD